ncbi:hypothetical protein ACHQM5_008646 [Ranunculus cassubicifolius]
MGSIATPANVRCESLLETSCGYLLQELKLIWDEVGQEEGERERTLLELEQECMLAYRRKVDDANMSRSRLHQALAESEAEFTHLLLSLGERSLPGRPEKMTGTLKEQLVSITPALQEMQLRKVERIKQFQDVLLKIQKASAEIAGHSEHDDLVSEVKVNENDLSLNKLEEHQIELERLHREKSDRLAKVEGYISAIRNLSATLGMDSSKIITIVHPSLDGSSGKQSKNISDDIMTKLEETMESLKEEKQKRLQKLKKLAKALTNLWSLMDTLYEDRRQFSHVTDFISISPVEISRPGCLALDIIQQAEGEVERLDQLKASKMKELFLKKQRDLEEICRKTHMGMPSQSDMDSIMELVKSGEIGHAELLKTMDEHIYNAKEEALSRKSIMEKVERWMSSRDEERWLEEYNMDENRYSVSRGAHKNLKRAERARITVNKIPGLIESLVEKTRSWEEERKKSFLYDEVPLLAMLDEYDVYRREKEDDKQRQREKKKVQIQGVVQQENSFGPRPSTSNRRPSNRSINGGFGIDATVNRRLSTGNQLLGSNRINSPCRTLSVNKESKRLQGRTLWSRQERVSCEIEDTASVVSAVYPGPLSP